MGVLAAHINNGRGVKTLLHRGITTGLLEQYPDVTLHLRPYTPRSVLDAAIEQGRIEKVTLVRYERPQDRAIAATDKWVRSGQIGRLELKITAVGRGERLKNALLRRFQHDQSVRQEIVEFEGLTFDEASVEVVLPDNGHKTYNIEEPDAGHPITAELTNLTFDDDGDPTAESLSAALKAAAGQVVTSAEGEQ